MGYISKSDVVRIGKLQKKRLEGMAAASGVSVRDMLDTLVDNADQLGVSVERNVNFGLLIDAEHRRRIQQYPTVAEVEQNERREERNGSKDECVSG